MQTGKNGIKIQTFLDSHQISPEFHADFILFTCSHLFGNEGIKIIIFRNILILG